MIDRASRGFAAAAILAAGAAAPAAADEARTPVTFLFRPASEPTLVTVAGTFNDWNPRATPLGDPDGDGVWSITLRLEPGRYQYKFVVNGTEWFTDESAAGFAPDGFGGRNSLLDIGDEPLTVGITPETQAAVEVSGTEVTFRFRADRETTNAVSVAGSFNGWNGAAHVLADPDRDGLWEITLRLEPGEHAYQFVLDGDRWVSDPSATRHEDDGFGGRNARLTVGGDPVVVGP